MYGRDDIYSSPASKTAALSSDNVGDAVAEEFGADYEWFGGSEHKQKKGRIAKITQKLLEMIQKEKFGIIPLLIAGAVVGTAALVAFAKKKDLHGKSKQLAKIVEKLQDKESDWDPDKNTKAFVDYGNSEDSAESLHALFEALGVGTRAPEGDAGGSDAGAGGDVTHPGDAAYYQAPPTGAYQHAEGPSGPGYDQGYDQGYAPGGGDTTNIYNYGPQGGGAGRPGKPQIARPQIAKPGWMAGGKGQQARPVPSLQGKTPSRPSAGTPKPRPSPLGKITAPFRPSTPKPQISKVPQAPKIPRAPSPKMAAPKMSAPKKILKKGAFGAMDSISREDLFGAEEISRSDLFGGADYLNELSFGVTHEPGGKALAAEMSYGSCGKCGSCSSCKYGALGSDTLDSELEFGDDVGADELDVDMDYGALDSGSLEAALDYGALTGGGLGSELVYGALDSSSLDAALDYGALTGGSLESELAYGGLDGDPHISTGAFRPTQGQDEMTLSSILDSGLDADIDDAVSEEFGAARPADHRKRDRRGQDMRTRDRRGGSPGSTAGVRGGPSHLTDAQKIRLAQARRAKGLPTPWLDAYEKGHGTSFGADDDQDADGAEIDLMLCDVEEVFGEDSEVASGGKLDLSGITADDDEDEVPGDLDADDLKPADLSGSMKRRGKHLGKSSPLIKRDLENQIERIGKQYETARKSGDKAKMQQLAQLHAKATSAYREAQKQPDLASRQQVLMNEKLGGWQY